MEFRGIARSNRICRPGHSPGRLPLATARVAAGFAAVGLIALSLTLAPAAGAATVTQRPVLFKIDGADVPDRPMRGGYRVAVDNATGAVYVSEEGAGSAPGRVFRFQPDGTLWPFPSTGLPYLAASHRSGMAVDNSGGPNESRLYIASGSNLRAFAPSGELLWDLKLPSEATDVAVDPTGHPHVAFPFGPVRKYANTGSPPAEISSFAVSSLRGIDVNGSGEVFLARTSFPPSVERWAGGSFSATIDSLANDVYLDQSSPTGSIYTTSEGVDERQLLVVDATAGEFRLSFAGAQTPDLPFNASESQITTALRALPTIGEGNVNVAFTPVPKTRQVEFRLGFLSQMDVEQLVCEDGTIPLSGGAGCSVSTVQDGAPSDVQERDAGGALTDTFGQGELRDARSAAYHPGLDRLYVAQSLNNAVAPSIVVLGPAATGTVGDVTIDPPDGIAVSSAHFSGEVNPQGTASEWRFQWRRRGEGWATASASPPQVLPADSADHMVEHTTSALRGSTPYEVRLIAVNTSNQLAGVSEGRSFTTTKAGQAPAVTIAAPSAVTTDHAMIGGTVNPQGDTADWRVQISTDPACESGFEDQPLQSLSPSSTTAVGVEYELSGLLPAQRYCARIVATNSAGSTSSEARHFETLDVLPTQVFAAYAAPRTDATARLNGYVNPHGSDATYRFEYSTDGSDWTVLPEYQTAQERRQITVAGEISGLEPATTYRYRFVVENDAGAVQSGEKSFQTRSTADMQLPDRGIELVNQPDKGNQNIARERRSGDPSMVRADGNRVVWSVPAGAPGGNTASGVNFLSIREPGGWMSQPLAPEPQQQVGGGAYVYRLNLMTPDFRTFLMRAAESGSFTDGPPTFVRTDDQHRHDVLKDFAEAVHGASFENADMTVDGSQVILQNPETQQLEEIGSGPHEVVSIMPDGHPATCGVRSGGFYGRGGGAGAQWTGGYHRMAITDGSRLYFEAFPNGGGCSDAPGHHQALFYRDRGTGITVQVDPGSALSTSPALIRATPDGRHLYFATETAHSPDDGNDSGDVYRWDSATDDYTCLTCVVEEARLSVGGGGFRPVRISDDFSHVYFSSQSQLVPGHGTPGEVMTYSLSDGELRLVASGVPFLLDDAMLSSDGDVLLFRADSGNSGELTADQQAEKCVAAIVGVEEAGCQALFRYEDSVGSLECLSCLPGGVTTHSVGEMQVSAAVSGDGSTVAFVTHEALLPEDVNGSEDVYEWRRGALRLISDGETAYPSKSFSSAPRVHGIDGGGDSIFFTIVDPDLTGFEHDKLANLYVARVGGGFPRPVDDPECAEEACQGPLQAGPPPVVVGTAGYRGSGNPRAGRTCRGLARRAKGLRRRARRELLRVRRMGAGDSRRARQGRRAARRLARRAGRLSHRARRCRHERRPAR